MKIVRENPLGHLGDWAAAAVIVVMGWGLHHASRLAEDSWAASSTGTTGSRRT